MKRLVAVILAAAGPAACIKTGTGLVSGVSSSCTVTLSGTTAGTYDCQPATTVWSSADNTGGFSFGVLASGTRPAISVSVVWPGEPRDTTYSSADTTAQGEVFVTTSTNQVWKAAVGQGVTATGAYSLTFNSVAANGSTVAGKNYAAEGTLVATLPAVTASGASGVIILSATF